MTAIDITAGRLVEAATALLPDYTNSDISQEHA
jgi:hypothetical protein